MSPGMKIIRKICVVLSWIIDGLLCFLDERHHDAMSCPQVPEAPLTRLSWTQGGFYYGKALTCYRRR